MLSHLASLIDEGIAKQLRELLVLNPTGIRQVVFGRFFMLEFLDRAVLSWLTNPINSEIISISVASSEYSIALMWLPENDIQWMSLPGRLFPLARQPPVVHCSTL